MIPKIKICGVTRTEDIELCEELGVDFVGFNFVPYSKRCITLERAQKLRAHLKKAKPILIFENQDVQEVQRTAKALQCEYLQFHGEESLEEIGALPYTVIKAFRYVPDAETLHAALKKVQYVLLDGTKNGELADVETIALLPENIRERLFLAGGLNAENIGSILSKIHSFAVDCASGVEESPGVKDPRTLRAFVDAVRTSSPSL